MPWSCIVIMKARNDHALPAHKEGGRWRKGDIVAVHPLKPQETDGQGEPAPGVTAPASRHFRIYSDLRDPPAVVRRRLIEQHLVDDDPENLNLVAKSKRRFEVSSLPIPKRNALDADGWVICSPQQVHDAIVKRRTNRRNASDPDPDAVRL